MPNKVFLEQIQFTYRAISINTENITHEESLVFAHPGGNCMNWLLGHILEYRNSVLGMLNQKPVWNEGEITCYKRGSIATEEIPDLMPWQQLLNYLNHTQVILVKVLKEEVIDDAGQIKSLARFSFHEAYHTGQLGFLRRVLGKEGAIKYSLMKIVIDKINELLSYSIKDTPVRIEQLPRSGSDRIYFRVFYDTVNFIVTYNLNVKENETFIAFSRHFKKNNLPVPEIYFVDDECTVYIQQDLGAISLLDKLQKDGYSENIFTLFKKSLYQLARLQICGHEGLDYNLCLTAKEFGKQAILSDLLYFKYYFLDTLHQPYDKQAMLDDFDALATYLTKTENKYFMFRDFQSRNIIVNNEDVFFIDYQGGMQGALQYDVASLLWQAKAQLSEEWKYSLLEYYMDVIDDLLIKPADRNIFVGQYNGYVLIRLLQVLGAYGFRGLFERKAHFLSSIPLALKNLKSFFQNNRVGIVTPELDKMLDAITGQDIIACFEPFQADEQTPLVVEINSFSYRKNIPEDKTGNGGGFVFDCRGLLNPGRFEEFKLFSGKDKRVIDFLEQRTRMFEFLNSVYDLIDISVEEYIKRGFTNLMISFGCTGGQHRSVYAAEQTARHLKNKYKVKTVVQHFNEPNWILGKDYDKPEIIT